MKVFVTGGCGFLGFHVCEFYAKKGELCKTVYSGSD
jgi:nucleoside-diphosphate-sugar epimerase